MVDIRARFDLNLSASTLQSTYAQAGVKFKRVDLHNINKLKKAREIQYKQRKHCLWLIRVMGKEKHVYWMDESSVHVWHQQRKTWTSDAEPVALAM